MGRRVAAGLVLAAAALGGCDGDGGSGDGGSGDRTADDPAPTAAATSASVEAPVCEQRLTATLPDGPTVALDAGTGAVRLADGAAYTLYAGDYALPADGLGTDTIVPPAGQHLATVFVTVYNPESTPPPIEPGTEVEYTSEFGELTFGVVAYAGEQAFGSAEEAAGTLTVEAVDDESICVTVDYRDAEKSLQGTLAAPVVDAGS